MQGPEGQREVSVHRLAQVIGKLSSTVQAILPAPLFYRQMQMQKAKALVTTKSYETMVMLSDASREELEWWTDHLQSWNGRAIISPGPDMVIQTDASKTGWGAFVEGQPRSKGLSGLWSQSETRSQINLLELKAAEFAVRALTKNKSNLHIHLKMDNRSALVYINKLGGTRSQDLVQATKSLWQYCMTKGITLSAEYLPGEQNGIADALSRHHKDSSNWKLERAVFQQLNRRWGPFRMDLFADRLNTQLPTFRSWRPDPQAHGTDA